MESKLTVYYSSAGGNRTMKGNQEKIFDVLESLKIDFVQVDICQNSDDKDKMRKIAGNPTALPPQIAYGDVYCGDFEGFDNAVESGKLEEFLKPKKENVQQQYS